MPRHTVRNAGMPLPYPCPFPLLVLRLPLRIRVHSRLPLLLLVLFLLPVYYHHASLHHTVPVLRCDVLRCAAPRTERVSYGTICPEGAGRPSRQGGGSPPPPPPPAAPKDLLAAIGEGLPTPPLRGSLAGSGAEERVRTEGSPASRTRFEDCHASAEMGSRLLLPACGTPSPQRAAAPSIRELMGRQVSSTPATFYRTAGLMSTESQDWCEPRKLNNIQDLLTTS